MRVPENRFRRRLGAGELQLGAFMALASPVSAELMATTGFDWLLIDGEHGPNDTRSVLAQLQALYGYPVAPVVRTRDRDPARLKPLIDIGVQSLLVPMVDSAGQAEALARALRYPPLGTRGTGGGLTRAARWGAVPDYIAADDQELCLVVQIESRAGVDAVAEIAAVDGVDGVFVGPADLAAALGHRGGFDHPEVREAVDHVLAAVRAAGKAAGVYAGTPELAAGYRERGASFLLVAADTMLLRGGAVVAAGQFRQALGAQRSRQRALSDGRGRKRR